MSEFVYGINAVWGVLKNIPKRVVCVFFVRKPLNLRLKLLMNYVEKCGIDNQIRDDKWMKIQVNSEMHQGIIAQIVSTSIMKENDLFNIIETHATGMLLLLVLDGITDPQNLGACFRIADAAGVHAIIVPRNRSVGLTGTVRKIASGSADAVPFIRVINLVRILKLLKTYNIWIVGTAIKSTRCIFYSKFIGSIALVMGSEDRGMRYLTQKYCDELVCIPISCTVESLNVSVASGICLFEILRQRNYQ